MKLIADEKIIASSPDPEGVYLYTPALTEGFDGRFVAAVDYGGPNTVLLDGPRSMKGDYKAGNQVRVYLSDDRGETWRETSARIPMRHEILFRAGKALYMIGASGSLVITRSDDNGETWSPLSTLRGDGRWHQSCGTVDIQDGKVTLAYEQFIVDDPVWAWPNVAPVLMQAAAEDDLTVADNWRFSKPYLPDPVMAAAQPSGIPALPLKPTAGMALPGFLETSVVRIHDPKHPFYDPENKTFAMLMRASTGYSDIGVMLKGVENPDGSLDIQRFKLNGTEVFFVYIPGADIKFHLCYDERTKLYWMVHSQITGMMCARRRLAVSYSPNLLNWTLAGLVAVGPSENGSRHYATMLISGEDMFILSRSGDERAKNAHDNNLTTFHRIRNFRRLVE